MAEAAGTKNLWLLAFLTLSHDRHKERVVTLTSSLRNKCFLIIQRSITSEASVAIHFRGSWGR
jgi:hypothetical protein